MRLTNGTGPPHWRHGQRAQTVTYDSLLVFRCNYIYFEQFHWERRGGGRVALSATTKYPYMVYDNSLTWRFWAAIFLSSVPHCLVSERSFSSKTKGDNPDRNHSICGQLQGRFKCTNTVAVPIRLLRLPWSVDTSQHVVPGDIDLCGKREWGMQYNHSSVQSSLTVVMISPVFLFVNDGENDDENDENILNYRRRD